MAGTIEVASCRIMVENHYYYYKENIYMKKTTSADRIPKILFSGQG